MTLQQVLIVSSHPLFREGIVRLLGDRADVVGSVTRWEDARQLPLERRPDVIIVDHDSPELKVADLAPLLWPDAEDLRVIYVTLSGDKMTIHERHQVSGAGEADLLRALQGSRPEPETTLVRSETSQNRSKTDPIGASNDPQRRKDRMEKRTYTKDFVIVAVLVAIVSAITIAVLLSLPLMPVEASTQAQSIDWLFDLELIIIGFLFSLIVVFMLYSLIVFRRRNNEEADGHHFEGHTKLEITWTVVPLIVVLILGFIGAATLQRVTAAQPEEMTVEVNAFSFGWLFSYPEQGIKNSPVMNLPIDQPILMKMKSNDADVNHNFWVPEFRVKQDLVPGVPTQLRVTPSLIGNYTVRCNELCGSGHTNMQAAVNVVSQADFDKWVQDQAAAAQKAPADLSPEEMATLGAEIYRTQGCAGCHSIDGVTGVGPTWKGLYEHEVELANDTAVIADEAYLKSSILDPASQIVKGFNPVMPATYKDTLTEAQISQLVEYIKSLK